MSMTRLETFVNLGLKKDPFTVADFKTGDALRVRRILTMAVESHAMVSIVGERGMGKTKAVRAAMSKISPRLVMVERAQKEKLTISDIEQAIILDLSDEKPRGRGEVRTRQLRRIAGEASRKQQIVVIIEEAHRLHGSTLRSLKTLREIQWMGESELFTVVLVGQSDPMSRAGVSEVRLRTDCVRMQGLAAEEVAGYVQMTLGQYFSAGAIEVLCGLSGTSNYLELQALLVELLNLALIDGRELVEASDVQLIAGNEQISLPRRSKKKVNQEVSSSDALGSVLSRRLGDSPVSAAS